jgi:arylsulfatase A-like enzyme
MHFPLLFLGLALTALAAEPATRPNIIVILADDLGYGDPGSYGQQRFHTPHLDRLAREGVRLTDFYADAPVCSPTRAALLTGRLPQRNGLTNVIETQDASTCLAAGERLISELLKQGGYRTGLIGKWHVGELPGFRPLDRGFDYFFGNLLGGLGFFTHDFMNRGQHDLWENHTPIRRDGQYVTDLLADASCQFLEQSDANPFFLFLSFQAMHTGMGSTSMNRLMEAPPRWIEHYAQRWNQPPDDPEVLYAACLSAMDEAAGRVLEKLEELKLSERTFIFFTSDNGPDPRCAGSAGPFRGAKHDLLEGGIRVPALARWPGRIPAGAVHSGFGITHDLLPTLLAVAGLETPAGLTLDGRNLLPILERDEAGPPRTLFWSYIRDTGRLSREKAVRRGPWKWLNGSLYNLENDPAERDNVAGKHPELAAELQQAWSQWVAAFPKEEQRWKGRDPLQKHSR